MRRTYLRTLVDWTFASATTSGNKMNVLLILIFEVTEEGLQTDVSKVAVLSTNQVPT